MMFVFFFPSPRGPTANGTYFGVRGFIPALSRSDLRIKYDALFQRRLRRKAAMNCRTPR